MKTIQFKLNGEARQFEAWPDQLFVEALRETFKIRSVKAGCSPQRECGSCLMLLDGQPKLACAVRAEQVQGRSVMTLEGVSDNERRLYADAFQAAAGLQCGFCTPGLVLRIKWMTDQGERFKRAEIARLIDGHLCRCTGYKKIIDAVELIQDAKLGGAALPAIVVDGGVGTSLRRYQSAELALGERPFVADIEAPGLIYGAVVLSAHARARIVRIDVSKALALAGVAAVATAADVPGDRWVGQIHADWPVFVAEGEEARYVGDVLAAVAADTPRRAREAAALVEVEYDPLPPALDPAEAIRPGAPQVNPRHDNVLSVTHTRAATSRRRWPPRRMSSVANGRRSGSSICFSNRRPALPGRCPTGACTSGARARESSRTGARSPRSSASRRIRYLSNWLRTAAPSAARRT